MTELLENRRQAIAEACRQYKVRCLYVFGSVLRGDFTPDQSDVDLLVEFEPMEGYARVDAYFGLLDSLRDILDADVDLVVAGAVKNPYISRDIEQTKQMLYAA